MNELFKILITYHSLIIQLLLSKIINIYWKLLLLINREYKVVGRLVSR
jgi:hypothetical protein